VAIKLGQITSKSKNIKNIDKEIAKGSIKNQLSFNFEKGQTYYLQLNLSSSNSDEVKVVLSNEKKFEMPVRMIPNFTDGVYDFIFTPDRDYTHISFASANVGDSPIIFQQLDNIFSSYTNIKEIGIQGFPGLRFSINGEGFTLGKSGFFYLSDIDIIQMGVFLKKEKNTKEESPTTPLPPSPEDISFIVSFQYDDKGGN
jgi:hypothetical protein